MAARNRLLINIKERCQKISQYVIVVTLVVVALVVVVAVLVVIAAAAAVVFHCCCWPQGNGGARTGRGVYKYQITLIKY